jgi:hypothetical protein
MPEMQISLTIKDDPDIKDGQLGLAVAAELPAQVGDRIQVHLEAYGFNPTSEGALSIASMLRDMATALERELGANNRGGTLPNVPRLDRPIDPQDEMDQDDAVEKLLRENGIPEADLPRVMQAIEAFKLVPPTPRSGQAARPSFSPRPRAQ